MFVSMYLSALVHLSYVLNWSFMLTSWMRSSSIRYGGMKLVSSHRAWSCKDDRHSTKAAIPCKPFHQHVVDIGVTEKFFLQREMLTLSNVPYPNRRPKEMSDGQCKSSTVSSSFRIILDMEPIGTNRYFGNEKSQ